MSTLEELQMSISDWDVNNAVFLSRKSFELTYRFRKKVAELMKESAIEFDNLELLSDLRGNADRVELALKEDLGIFVVEFPQEDKVFKSFQDAAKVGGEDHKTN